MKHSLPVSLALLSLATDLQAQSPYTLPAVDSVSVSRSNAQVFNDNRLRAYNNPNSALLKVVGLFKFDLSPIPVTDDIVSMRLVLSMENAFNSPLNGPIVNLVYSPDDTWTRTTATTSSGLGSVVVTANQSNFVHPSHTFTIDLSRHNFRKDLADRTLTLVIENVNAAYSYVYFFGHTGSPAGPNAQLHVTTATCNGSTTFFGSGGRDSKSFAAEGLASGCPDRGRTLSLGAALGEGNLAPILLFLGRSSSSWATIPLPFSLAPIGAPGNSIYASLEVFVGVVPNPGGGGLLPLPIPSDQALANASIFFQSLVIDLQANNAGVVMTDALNATLR